jgi:hypothetical protein
MRGPDSSVGIATRYGLEGPFSIHGGGENFRTRPDRLLNTTSFLHNGHRVFSDGITFVALYSHTPPSNPDVKEAVEV